MSKFIEVSTDGNLYLVNVERISYVEKWSDSTTVIHLENDVRINTSWGYNEIKRLITE